ncbi:hypothetical protein BSM4216_2969 [Bacillus smithii]|nr:hypothetical protein BSM4216_2969 [Bacillus smithii]
MARNLFHEKFPFHSGSFKIKSLPIPQQEKRPSSKVEFFISPFLVVGEFAYWNVV